MTTAKVPQPAVPFLDEAGNVARPWYYFLLSLYARTGGPSPVPPPTVDYGSQIQAALGVALTAGIQDMPPSPGSIALLASIMIPPPPPPPNSLVAAYVVRSWL